MISFRCGCRSMDLRVNTVCAQFDEFVQTYGLTEENRMYIPPEERIKIW